MITAIVSKFSSKPWEVFWPAIDVVYEQTKEQFEWKHVLVKKYYFWKINRKNSEVDSLECDIYFSFLVCFLIWQEE